MAIFTAEREGIARRIGESSWRSVDDLRDERKSLQRSRAELFEKKQRGEVIKVAFIREGKNSAEPLQVHILRADIMSFRHDEPAGLVYRRVRMLPGQLEQCVLRRFRSGIDQIHDH